LLNLDVCLGKVPFELLGMLPCPPFNHFDRGTIILIGIPEASHSK
jgi:hypothetical protein